MKNFKIVMILVAAVAFFCSCTKKTVTVTMTEKSDVVTYDLSSANSLPIAITCNVKADAGINTLKITRTVKNGDEVVGDVVEFVPGEDPAGLTDYTVEILDTLFKANLAAGYSVVYDATATDKKDNSENGSVTITIVETATPIAANWSDPIALSNQSWATYTGATVAEQNETIGVKCLGKNDHKAYNLYAEPTTGASWVFVESIEGLTTNEALVEAYNNGEVVTSRTMFPATDEGKAYSEKFFICKNKDGEYVLVDYIAGRMNSGSNDHGTGIGNVMVFKYKKAETTPAAK